MSQTHQFTPLQQQTSFSDEYDAEHEQTLNGAHRAPAPAPRHQKAIITDAPIAIEPVRLEDFSASYAMELRTPEMGFYASFKHTMGDLFGKCGMIPCCFCCPNPFVSVNQGNVGLVTRFGQFYKAVDPGLVQVNPLSEKITRIDVRVQVIEIASQSCMTRDNVNIELSSVIYYHIVSPHRAVYAVQDVHHALIERTKTTLRLVVGSRTLQEIIERREEVASSIQEIIDEVTEQWGVHVESILIKDIVMSSELRETLAQAAKSKRIGESKIITARAEVESAKLMRKAADILESKAAMQIRYLDAMQNMAKQGQTKVIFMPSSKTIESMAQDASGVGASYKQDGVQKGKQNRLPPAFKEDTELDEDEFGKNVMAQEAYAD